MSALSDLVVVDASYGLAGPVAGLLLADAGARVIKVEPPWGDPLRGSPGFATWNRNKEGVVLDLHQEVDRNRLHDLLARADVFIHCFTPARAADFGLDDPALTGRHPALVVSAVTGYPAGSEDANRYGHDILVQARSGWMDEQIVDRPGPAYSRLPLPSWGAAMLAAVGILARLHHRATSSSGGGGGSAHTSLLQGILACMSTVWQHCERPSERIAQKLPLPKRANPHTFRCAGGGWIQVNSFYPTVPLITESLLELGVPIPPDDTNPTEKAEVYRPVFLQRSANEWLVACWSADVSAQPVSAFGDLLRDPQSIANGYLIDIEDPIRGRIRIPGTPWSAPWPSAAPAPAPGLGEQSVQLLEGEVRYSAEGFGRSSRARSPLEGLKVVDFGSFVGGPYATTLLAQLGADVIKVEPKTGDRMRLDDLIFGGTQAGKRSLGIDLKARGAQDVVKRLIQWADVIHHNIRSSSLAGLALDYESVRAVNPGIIYCHVSGFGPNGAKRFLPVFDPEMQALAGWLGANTPGGETPTMVRCAPTDIQGALLSLVPTLIALYRRDRTGHGAEIETSILGAMSLITSETALNTDTGLLAHIPPVDDEVRGLAPWYRLYQTADGDVAVAALTKDRQTALLAAVQADNFDSLAEAFTGLRTDQAIALLAEYGVPAEAARANYELAFLQQPANLNSGLSVRHSHPIYGTVTQIGALWDFGDLHLRLDRAAPTLGQHTREVLLQLGLPDAEVRFLAAQGVVVGDALI